MASGKRWQPYIGKAVACPPEMPFGTKIKAFNKIWVCLDRGSAIQYEENIPWMDFLVEKAHLSHGKKHIVMIKEK